MRLGAASDQLLRFPGQEYDDQTPERAYNIFRWYRAGWGRYTQNDPIGAGDLNAYGYAASNPQSYVDPYGLYAVKENIKKKPTLSPEAICGSTYACSKLSVYVTCNCECIDGNVFANAQLNLTGEMAYYTGPYAALKKKPVDKTVKDAQSAIAHEYNYHIDPALQAVEGLLIALEKKAFSSEQECYTACGAATQQVSELFFKTLKQTQAAENAKK